MTYLVELVDQKFCISEELGLPIKDVLLKITAKVVYDRFGCSVPTLNEDSKKIVSAFAFGHHV